MGLKAGWLALFFFVWIIGVFLGSTFDYYDSDTGQTYSTGTATFVQGSRTVTVGGGGVWVAGMAGGFIKANADNTWYKIASVNGGAGTATLQGVYLQAGGAGLAYTMQAAPNWAGTGTGGYATAPMTKVQRLIGTWQAHQDLPLLGRLVLVVTNGDFWSTAWDMVTWQWSFMDGYEMLWLILFAPFVIMGILSMILLIYGVLTGNVTWG